ncbi:related to allantoate permease [Phialocephala subalpina]|uniref:Related to allantoate permease n=1 Tax=Phialocephala subalpina TaxID=576137 RepID=A0A1L7X0N5_9HELO|nr:related to allantoate permease [Phialocephala subalpina]
MSAETSDATKKGSIEPAVRNSIEIAEVLQVHADEAFGFVEKHEGFTYTLEQGKAVLRKIDKHLMPLMFISYLFQYMDKSVMAQSLIYGLQESLNLKEQEYSWCGSAFYFGYLAFQPFAGRLLNYLPLGRFVSITALSWGIILLCTPGAKSFSGLFACRFFLGMAEGGVSPAYVLITGMWYKKDEIPQRVTFWFTGNGVAIVIQALVSCGIGHINTSVATWRWFFIIFGIAGLVWAGVLYMFMPDSPLTAKFLSEEEKAIAIERLRDNRTGVANKEFKKYQLMEALKDPIVYYSFFYAISCVVPNSGVSFFGAQIIKGMGFNNFTSSVLLMPFGLCETIGLLTSGYLTRKIPNIRCLNQFAWCVPAVFGAALVYCLPSSNRAGRLAGFYCTGFSNVGLPLQFSLMSSNVAGHTKRGVSNAIMFFGYATGFIVGPQFFLSSEAPAYPTGFKTMIITFGTACLGPLGLWAYLIWINRKREKMIRESGNENVYARNEEFLDLTDKEQIHFVYSR